MPSRPPAPARRRARLRLVACALLAGAAVGPVGAIAFANVEVGGRLDPASLRTLDGRTEPFLSGTARVNVFIFFRPSHDHSLETLKAMAACEDELRGKPVHWVAIASSTADPAAVRRTVADSGIRMPVLVDEGDRLYGKLGVRLHPVVGVADGQYRLLAYEPFMKVNYCDRIRARIQLALGEITPEQARLVDAPERATMPGEIDGAALKRRVRLGEILLKGRQFDKAAAEARAVLERDPRSTAAHVLLGDALAGQGLCPEATRAYDAALALEPASAAAREGKAACGATR